MFRTHIGRSPDYRFIQGQRSVVLERIDRLGYSEVNHLGNHLPVLLDDKNIGRLEVAMNDSLLMGVFDCPAHLDQEGDPGFNRQRMGVAVTGDGFALHEIHHEVRPSIGTGSRVKNLGNVRVIHHRQGLSFDFEPADDTPGIHAQLENFERNRPLNGILLLHPINRTSSPFSHQVDETVGAYHISRTFSRRLHRLYLGAPPGRIFNCRAFQEVPHHGRLLQQ